MRRKWQKKKKELRQNEKERDEQKKTIEIKNHIRKLLEFCENEMEEQMN